MHTDVSHVLVKEHVRRLRDAAQAPPRPFFNGLWLLLRRQRREPASTAWIARASSSSSDELDQLAA